MTLQETINQLLLLAERYPQRLHEELYVSYNYGDHWDTEAIKPLRNVELVYLGKTGYAHNELKIGEEWGRWCVDMNPDMAPFGAPEEPTEDEQPQRLVIR